MVNYQKAMIYQSQILKIINAKFIGHLNYHIILLILKDYYDVQFNNYLKSFLLI